MRGATAVRRRHAALPALVGALLLAPLPALPSPAAAGDDGAHGRSLHVVVLEGAGTSAGPDDRAAASTRAMLATQADVLASVSAPAPVYQWTTALDGFAVELDADQAAALQTDPRVAVVEADAVRPLATLDPADVVPGRREVPEAGPHDGAGTVIGFVDSGIDPSATVFAPASDLGSPPRGFRGSCADAPDDHGWSAADCTAKVVGAQHFVSGFGADRLAANDALSPRDTDGHGTQVAAVAAGTAATVVEVAGERLGRFTGVAPRARIASYKACWSAPDPADDGCSTADLVAAVDQATHDQVDVLNVSVGGPSRIDVLDLALLGAAEADIVVTAPAGNEGDVSYAAHPAPWVLTVGATTSPQPVGGVVTDGGPRLTGAMAADRTVARRPLVLAAEAAADDAAPADARVCAPGSLDAAVVAGAVVLCERGRTSRVAKSRTVALADGAGMVLVNTRRGPTHADLHAVPTVHLGEHDGRRLARWARHGDAPEVRLVPRGVRRGADRVAPFSSPGDPTSSLLKPDLVSPGTGVLAAVPGSWELASGTSISAAVVSGRAAALLGRPGVTAAEVRSALVTAAAADAAPSLLRGAGRVDAGRRPSLAYLTDSGGYRAWLAGRAAAINQPHALLSGGRTELRRTLTNVSDRSLLVRADLAGFRSAVLVHPAGAVLAPGEEVEFTVTLSSAPVHGDAGAVVWRTGRGEEISLAVVVTR